MSGDTTETSWNKLDLTDPTDRSLITDISGALSMLSSEKRAERKRQKLRDELVREYIENKNRAPTLLQSLLDRLKS